jgi:hypothetical protein
LDDEEEEDGPTTTSNNTPHPHPNDDGFTGSTICRDNTPQENESTKSIVTKMGDVAVRSQNVFNE